jgi:hypothetical protein
VLAAAGEPVDGHGEFGEGDLDLVQLAFQTRQTVAAEQVGTVMTESAELSLALPSAPIGVGARWTVVSSLVANGLALRLRQVATLRAIEGDVLTITLRGKQTGIPGPVALPGLPAGYTAELVELDGATSGRTIVDLAGIVPRSRSAGTVTVYLPANAFSTWARLRPVAITRSPDASAAFVISAPMPREAPVMNQTLLMIRLLVAFGSCGPCQRAHPDFLLRQAGADLGDSAV